MSKRDALVQAAKELLWERGFSAMSPRDVLERSRAGQGSLYHFFDGKEALAKEALAAVAEEVSRRVEASCGVGTGSGLARVDRFLLSDRDALRGCRLGRLAQDPELPESLREAVAGGFARLEAVLEGAVLDAQREAELPADVDPRALAECMIAVVQGGYVLSRAHGSAEHMTTIVRTMAALLPRLDPARGTRRKPVRPPAAPQDRALGKNKHRHRTS
jgi:TetR/AcrR family transcriptional regulator, transcriptional repressor for nem operon